LSRTYERTNETKTNTNNMYSLTLGRSLMIVFIIAYLIPIITINPHMLVDTWLVIPLMIIVSGLFSGLNKSENQFRPIIQEVENPDFESDIIF
jgi:hypothetical protein